MFGTRFAAVVFFLFIVLSASFAEAATWSGPPAGTTPPNNNVDAPVNVGSTFQDKTGSVWFDGGVGINSGSKFCISASCITSWPFLLVPRATGVDYSAA